MVCTHVATRRNTSWLISNMVATTERSLVIIANSTLKEYEIIILIYNRKKHAG